MAKWACLVGAVVLLALSVACITTTVVEMARGAVAMGSGEFWGALVFHPVAGLCGLLLLYAVRPRKAASPAGAGEGPAAEEGQR